MSDDRFDELTKKSVSRRDFLKVAGVAGVAVGASAGLGGLLAACGGTEESTTTTAGATTTTAGATTTTAGATTTSASAGVETGAELKMGFVAPLTGPLASFGVPDTYCADRWREACGDGIVCGDGKKHPVSIEVMDSQSDSNRAAQVAGDLINNSKVDVMMVASTPDTVTPVVEQCEANGCPVVSTDCPWQTYMGANKEYKWSYHSNTFCCAFFGFNSAYCSAPLTRLQPADRVLGPLAEHVARAGDVDAQELRQALGDRAKPQAILDLAVGPSQVARKNRAPWSIRYLMVGMPPGSGCHR